MNKSNEIFKSIKISIVLKPLSIGLSFVIIPLTMNYLGGMKYGLWATMLSLLTWINYLDFGLGNGLRTYLVKSIVKNDSKRIHQSITTTYFISTIISCFLFFIGLVIVHLIDWDKFFGLQGNMNNKLSLVIIVNLLFVSINITLKIINSIIYSYQESHLINVSQIINQIMNLLGILVVIKLKMNQALLIISIIYGCSMTLSNLLITFIIFHKYSIKIFRIKYITLAVMKKIYKLGMDFFIMQLGFLCFMMLDNIIITKLYGVKEVTPYSITLKLFNIIIVVHSVIITPIWSSFTKAVEEKDFKWIKNIIKKVEKLQVVIFFITLLLYGMFPYILKTWIGDSIKVGISLRIMFAIYVILNTYSNAYAYCLNGMGKIKFQRNVVIIQGLLNAPLSIVLAKTLNFGVSGVILATNILLTFSIIMYKFKLKINIKKGEKNENY